jgi:hypothetical protein
MRRLPGESAELSLQVAIVLIFERSRRISLDHACPPRRGPASWIGRAPDGEHTGARADFASWGLVTMKWRYRFGLKFMLAMVLLAALILGWVVPEQRRADARTALVAELAGVGVRPILEEPTAWGLLLGGGTALGTGDGCATGSEVAGSIVPLSLSARAWRTSRSLMPWRGSGVWGSCGRSTPRVRGCPSREYPNCKAAYLASRSCPQRTRPFIGTSATKSSTLTPVPKV